MVLVAMYSAVAQESHKVQVAPTLLGGVKCVGNGWHVAQRLVVDSNIDATDVLIDHAPRPQVQVSHL